MCRMTSGGVSQLVSLNLCFTRYDSFLQPTPCMTAALSTWGTTLTHLSLKGVSVGELFLKCLAQHCKLLESLEAGLQTVAGATQLIIDLVNSCPCLRALTIFDFWGTVHDIDVILAAGRPQQLKRFVVTFWNQTVAQLVADFAHTCINIRG